MNFFYLFLLLLPFLAGCGVDTDQAKEAVLHYNARLVEAYASGDVAGLEEVVTPDQAVILDERLRDFANNKIRLQATLRSIGFTSIEKTGPGQLRATTDESWDFSYQSLASGQLVTELAPRYAGSYSLVEEDGRWLVDRVVVEPVEELAAEPAAPAPPAPQEGVAEEQVAGTVLTYLALLADGYRTMNMTPLLHVASPDRAQKAYHHMAAMGEARVKMDPGLQSIELGAVRLTDPAGAEVDASEKWLYVYYRTDSGRKVYENEVSYELTYFVVRSPNGGWLVDEIRVNSTVEGPGTGELEFYRRPADEPVEGR